MKGCIFVMLAALASSQMSCAFIARMASMMPPPTKKIAAEFTRMAGRKVLVHVWVEPAAQIDYPWARYELAEGVVAGLEAHVKNIEIVEPARIEDHLEKTYQNTVDPVTVGRKFGADMVVYLEVSRISMRDPATPQLYRGRIHSSVVVYDLTDDDAEPQRFELTPVEVQVPKGRAQGVFVANPQQLRLQTYAEYAAEVALRFYDHEVEI